MKINKLFLVLMAVQILLPGVMGALPHVHAHGHVPEYENVMCTQGESIFDDHEIVPCPENQQGICFCVHDKINNAHAHAHVHVPTVINKCTNKKKLTLLFFADQRISCFSSLGTMYRASYYQNRSKSAVLKMLASTKILC